MSSATWPVAAVSLPGRGSSGSWRGTGRNNEEMVDKFVHMGIITAKEIEEAFRAVPRGAFVPPDLQVEAYIDSPLRGEPHVHMSAPHMYATVLEALDLSPGLSFLNIGSGTGYFSCLAGCILQSQGINHGIELHEDLVEFAKGRVDEYLRFSPAVAHEICPPKFIAGNCFRLDPSKCSYDRVYCGAACPASKVPFILGLIKIGGLAVIPCRSKLLKIERVSRSEVKQTCISEVCFASLVALPDSKSSLPKLHFPPESPRRKEKTMQVFPPSDVLVSRGQARTLLARLRALQEASECLQTFQSLPLALCYVPSRQQIQQYLDKNSTLKSGTVVTSPVDRKISFFGRQSTCRESGEWGSCCAAMETERLWKHLQQDRLWETVLEYYYSLCNVSNEKRRQAMNVYIRQRVKQNGERKESKKCLSYAAIAHKLGILTAQTHSSQENDIPVEPTLGALGSSSCPPNEANSMSSNHCDSAVGVGASNCTETSRSECEKAGVSSDPVELPTSSSCESHQTSSASGPSTKELTSQESLPHNAVESCTSLGSDSSQHVNVLIEMDEEHMDKLSSMPSGRWSIIEDLVLVRFLCDVNEKSNQGRCKGWFKAASIVPELFSKMNIMSHPRLSCYSPEDLTYRATVLCRIAKILDSVLYLLSGPSLLKGQSIYPCKYQLESFTESSFTSSWTLSGSGHLSPLSNRKENVQVDEVRETDDSDPINLNSHQPESVLKNIKVSQPGLYDRYKEELKLVKKQIHLIEEQKQLVHNMGEPAFVVDQDVSDAKLQRQEAFMKQQKLKDLQSEQDQNKTNLLALLKKLREEERQLAKKVESSVETPASENLNPPRTSSSTEAVNKASRVTNYPHKWRTQQLESQESSVFSVRYHLSALLPKMRFLLPLCSQRWRLVQGLLHSTELSAPDYMPVITVDRRVPLGERHTNYRNSVFLQMHRELRAEKLHFRWNKWKYDQWWEVKFVGEGIIDQGGGFRDSLAEIADELCPPGENVREILPYFIKSPNHKEKTGDYQDCYIPSPCCEALDMFEWLGCLMGGVYRSDESLTLSMPPFVWKLLVGEHVTWAKDFVAIDETAVQITDELEIQDEAIYQDVYGSECTFSTVLSGGRHVDLLPGGEGRVVKPDERQQYASLVRRARMTEFTKQVQAIRQGLMSVIPESVLNLLTWRDLEIGVCGDRLVTLAQLKTACKYGDNLSESSESVKHLWTVLTQFSSEERSRFLRFVTGRKRPPAPFTVAKAGGDWDSLPHASTCASTLFLSEYSSSDVARQKLRYAISNCVAIDTDTSPW